MPECTQLKGHSVADSFCWYNPSLTPIMYSSTVHMQIIGCLKKGTGSEVDNICIMYGRSCTLLRKVYQRPEQAHRVRSSTFCLCGPCFKNRETCIEPPDYLELISPEEVIPGSGELRRPVGYVRLTKILCLH